MNAIDETHTVREIDDSTLSAKRLLSLKLVNMPISDCLKPPYALAQLAGLVQRELADKVDTQICYLNQDFATYADGGLYEQISNDSNHVVTGIGDWMFRHIAFPYTEDNSEDYFQRYYVGPNWAEFRENVLSLRPGLMDYCLSMIERYDLARADIVGFTSMFAQNVPSLALARLIKQQNPKVTIIMGGANCEAPMGSILAQNFPGLDFVFSGPSLETLLEFLRRKLAGDVEGLHNIHGVVSKQNCRNVKFRNSIGDEHDINDFFEPDYKSFFSSFNEKKASIAESRGCGVEDLGKPFLYFETSRGCWWGERSHCTFCGLNDETIGFKKMSPEVALRQFEWLFKFAPWATHFESVDNIMPRNYPEDVFKLINPPANSTIFYEIKVPVSDESMQVLADAKILKVQPGIEALSTSTLKLMGKGTTAFQNVQFLKKCVKYGIQPEWNLLAGFPGEDASTYPKYVKDLPLLRHLPPPAVASVVRFERYSPYFVRSSDYNLDLRPADFYSFIYPFSDEDLAEMAYFFENDKISAFQVNAAMWLPRLVDSVDQWTETWDNADRRARLELVQRADGSHVIHDSRGEFTETYGIDEQTTAILKRLSSPARHDRIASEIGLTPQIAAEKLSFMRSKGLLFEEDDRVLSLVLT